MPWSPRNQVTFKTFTFLYYFSSDLYVFWKEIFCSSDHFESMDFSGLFVPNGEHLSSQPQLDTHPRLPHF